VLAAAAAAYETFCNFTDILERERGWDQVLHGVVASAVASAKLLGLDEQQLGEAIALAIVPNLPLEQTRSGELSMWKGCAAANASRNGVFAALLAQLGMQGPGEAIEGRWGLKHAIGPFEWAPFGGEGAAYRIARTMIKPFPAVIHAQSPASVAMALRAQVDVADIRSIAIHTYWVANRYTDRASPLWQPGTRETADHSIPYVVAAALVDGAITDASFDEQHLANPRIRALMAATTVHEDPAYTSAYPQRWACRIEVGTRGGHERTGAVDHFKGHPDNPMSDRELEEKFRALAAPRLDRQRCDAILARFWSLETVADIGEAIALLRW
jgi:2-methylcitrate dehydratase